MQLITREIFMIKNIRIRGAEMRYQRNVKACGYKRKNGRFKKKSADLKENRLTLSPEYKPMLL
jgi:hypothetical protein